MRKFIVIGVMILAALTAAVNVIFAQDTTTDAAATAWLGVALAENDNQVVIARVQPNSPADEVGLLADDVIVSFNGEAVSSPTDLSELVKAAAPGDTATLEILRDDESQTIEVTLGSAPAGRQRGPGFAEAVDPITMAERLLNADLETADGGFIVLDVLSIANPFSLEEGDLVTALNGQSITELDLSALRDTMIEMDEPALTLSVIRAGEEITLESDLMSGRFGFGRGRDGFGRGPGNRGGPGRPDVPPPAAPDDTALSPAGQA
jgi:S1-C subfamily serine protease